MALGQDHLQPVRKCGTLQFRQLQLGWRAKRGSFRAVGIVRRRLVVRKWQHFGNIYTVRQPAVRRPSQVLWSRLAHAFQRDLITVRIPRVHRVLRQTVGFAAKSTDALDTTHEARHILGLHAP